MKNKSYLLVNERELHFQPSLALAVGVNEAIVIQKVHEWLNSVGERHEYEDRPWVRNSLKQWHSDNFPFWSEDTIARAITSLRKQGILLVTTALNLNAHDQTLWYSIDYDKLDNIPLDETEPQNADMDNRKMRQSKTAKSGNDLHLNHTLNQSLIAHSAEWDTDFADKHDADEKLKGKTKPVQPHIALIDAWHAAIPENIRPGVKPSYNRNVTVAKELLSMGIAPDDITRFMAATNPGYMDWAIARNKSKVMTLEHVKQDIRSFLDTEVQHAVRLSAPKVEYVPVEPEYYVAPSAAGSNRQ